MAIMILYIIVGVLLLLLMILLLFLIIFVCKPWRFLIPSRSRTIKVDDLERPLLYDGVDEIRDQSNEAIRESDLEGACFQNEGLLHPPRLVHKQMIPPNAPHLNHDDSVLPDIISEPLEDLSLGQTLKRGVFADDSSEGPKHGGHEDQSTNFGLARERYQVVAPQVITQKSSCLSLDVISGPSSGINYTVQSTNGSRLPLTIGRVHPSDLLLNDSEVSGKHAMINWNLNETKWELVDMGSLNGTLLNSKPINHPDSGSRRWGDPFDLSSEDTITLGTTSNISVHISSQTEHQIPFSIGVATDPMALRRGGKKLPMEDVYYYQWPLTGTDQFGLFGVCDGHGGAAAAKTASKVLPEMVASILSDSLTKEKVLSHYDASEVLRGAFSQTEACMKHHQYEGCTATLLLVWADGGKKFYAQCANVGDSACVINVEGKHTKMTEDHRITSYSERLRLNETGEPLRDGETRLCGLNLARMLGDKFLKEHEARFSSEPYVSEVVHIDQESNAFALLASDGFWDVISVKKAVQLVNQTREKYSTDEENSAEKVANFLLSEARTLRTKDNTSIVFLDFSRISYCKANS